MVSFLPKFIHISSEELILCLKSGKRTRRRRTTTTRENLGAAIACKHPPIADGRQRH